MMYIHNLLCFFTSVRKQIENENSILKSITKVMLNLDVFEMFREKLVVKFK